MNLEEYRRPQYPVHGVPVSELAAALAVVAAAAPAPVGETRVLQLDSRREGYLHVQTGSLLGMRAGCGKDILLMRTDDGWKVVEVSTWRA
jgi:hypothetical protein